MILTTCDRRKLREQMAAGKTTTLQKVELLERRNKLRHRISNWRDIQNVYMPGVVSVRSASISSSTMAPHPEDEILWLPSALSSAQQLSACTAGLADKERRLRLGQAEDALHLTRRQLRVTSTIIDFKRGQHAASQQITTRTRDMMTAFRNKTNGFAARYNDAYNALKALDPDGEWTHHLRPLDIEKDLTLPCREESDVDAEKRRRRERDTGENRRGMSWIWQVLINPESTSSASSPQTILDGRENSDGMYSSFHEKKLLLIFELLQ